MTGEPTTPSNSQRLATAARTLLGLVAEATGLVLAGGAVHTHDLGQLAVGADTGQAAAGEP